MTRPEYTADHHRLAYMHWLQQGSYRKAAAQKGMPSVPTVSEWSKASYNCPYGCKYHGWDKLKKTGDDGKTPEQLTVKTLPMQEAQPNLTPKERILERRKAQIELRIKGMKRAEIHRALSGKFEATPRVLDEDWSQRSRWILEVFSLTDVAGMLGTRMATFQVINKARWCLVEMLEAVVAEWKKTCSVDDNGKPRAIQPEDIQEIAGVLDLLRGLLSDIDRTGDREVRAVLALGIKVDFEKTEKEDDFVDIGGTEVGLIDFLDNILDAVPAEHRDMLYMAFEQAMHTPQEGSAPSKN